ncbi:PspA/IM30 family protein [Paenibacillus caui]|uniref:PspA/IM30 family protein n=1 Tax=Paenibacillus caui TaxID=2873927 RepID=UPI001CA9D7B4|nr:PspA/IM30 family protein [Paenibacillus caui]
MGFFERLKRIASANLNSALDNLEDPILMIDEVLRELDENIAKVTTAVTSQMAVEKRFERELTEADAMIEKRDAQARQALAQGEEELAREALIDKKRYIEKREELDANYQTAKASSGKLKEQLEDMKEKVQDMKLKRSTLVAQAEAAKASKTINETMSGVGDDNLSDTFAKLEDKILRFQDQASAAQELANEGQSLDDKFEKLAKQGKDHEIEDELAKLKAELNQK